MCRGIFSVMAALICILFFLQPIRLLQKRFYCLHRPSKYWYRYPFCAVICDIDRAMT